MTANQIEYWKLQETRRHNVATEEMDRPVKESQVQLNLSSAELNKEYALNQPTVRALNLAQEKAAYAAEAANYASAAASYATAQERYTAAALNTAKVETEETVQGLNLAKAGYTDVQTRLLGYQEPQAMADSVKGWAQYNYLDFNTKEQRNYAKYSIFNEYGGSNIIRAGSDAARAAYTIFSN